MQPILRLFPLPGAEIALEGAYLGENLRQYAGRTGRPFLYANFVASLDGRIALPPPGGTVLQVPKSIANERDWRLYQELAAQADIILSSGRYLRDWAAGRAQEILQVDDPRFADLRAWRHDHGLPPQADIAIVSASLDFPIPTLLTSGGRRFVVATVANPDPSRVDEIKRLGGRVVIAGKESVDGALLVEAMAALGYRTIYSAAGPRILHLLVTGGALDFLYVTAANRLLGGVNFATLLQGPPLDPPVGARIRQIYLDEQALGGLGQVYLSYQIEKAA
jgi:riboflavin biosynthesis pyrimidine reductase